MSNVMYEKTKFAVKSLVFAGFIVAAIGSMSVVLFAPELAANTPPASVHGHHRHSYAASLPSALEERVANINWGGLVSLDSIEHMAQGCAILRASPEGMFFIVAFHLLRKISNGESITIGNIGDEVVNTLPTDLLPDFYPLS